MFKRLLKRRADSTLLRENERLSQALAKAESKIKIQSLEIDELTAVVARNIKRVEAETAAAATKIGDLERSERSYAI